MIIIKEGNSGFTKNLENLLNRKIKVSDLTIKQAENLLRQLVNQCNNRYGSKYSSAAYERMASVQRELINYLNNKEKE